MDNTTCAVNVLLLTRLSCWAKIVNNQWKLYSFLVWCGMWKTFVGLNWNVAIAQQQLMKPMMVGCSDY